MSETDEEVVGRCAFCDSDENITFIVLPNSSNLVTTCSRCAVVLEEARRHLEQTATWYRDQEVKRIDEMRGMMVIGAVVAGVGAGVAWGPGLGAVVGGVVLAGYGLARGIRG